MAYVLIIVGLYVTTLHDFSSKEACENAKKIVHSSSYCMPK